MINFYHMKGCPHCVLANTELQSLIDSGKVKKLPMEDAANKGVKGFPFFEYVDADGIVLKTSTGWGGKQNLFNNLGYIETFENYHPEHIFQDQNYKEEFKSQYKQCQDNCYTQTQNKNMTPNTFDFNTEHYFCMLKDNCYDRTGAPQQKPVNWAMLSAEGKFNKYKEEQARPKPVGGVNNFNSGQSSKCVECTRACVQKRANMGNPSWYTMDDCLNEGCAKICKEGFSENYKEEFMPSYPVIESMEENSQVIHYDNHTGAGYSKLSNCWVKRPDYTA
jgi:hypothetical protein